MKRLISGWVHKPGAHCASTAVADVMTHAGHPMSENMCFGIGCGLGFAYFQSPAMTPTRMTATRSRMLEPRFFENMGMPFQWFTEKDPARAAQAAKEHISEGRPLLIRADIAHLPHYNSKTHFPPHVIALWGFDEEKREFYVADTGWEGLLPVSYEDLEKARYGGNAYVRNTADHFPVEVKGPLPRPRDAARKALLKQAADLEGLGSESPAVFGFRGMENAAAAMSSWGETEDWQWCARWFYQVIEKRGTGGGAFRLLYAGFLREIAKLDPAFHKAAPAQEMERIAAAWTRLSEELKTISESHDPSGLSAAADMLSEICSREREFFSKAQKELS